MKQLRQINCGSDAQFNMKMLRGAASMRLGRCGTTGDPGQILYFFPFHLSSVIHSTDQHSKVDAPIARSPQSY